MVQRSALHFILTKGLISGACSRISEVRIGARRIAIFCVQMVKKVLNAFVRSQDTVAAESRTACHGRIVEGRGGTEDAQVLVELLDVALRRIKFANESAGDQFERGRRSHGDRANRHRRVEHLFCWTITSFGEGRQRCRRKLNIERKPDPLRRV